MSQRLPYLAVLLAAAICLGCQSRSDRPADHPVLKVSLEECSVSLSDLFTRVELVPLATTEESLFAQADKIEMHHDTIFLFDRASRVLHIFAPDGDPIRSIRKIGRGPGEYTTVSDFTIDPEQRTVLLLDPTGRLLEYGFDGTFLRERSLPRPPMNCRFVEWLAPNSCVTWSSVYETGQDAVRVLDRENRIRHSAFPHSSLWGSLCYGSVFNRYRDTIYYHESLSGWVYAITPDRCRIAYEWDPGIRPIDPGRLVVDKNALAAAQQQLFEDYMDGTIPFFFGPQLQSDRYYYTLLTFSQPAPVRKSLFYDRKTGESRLFAKTKEGLSLDLKYMTDDYAVGLVGYEERKALKGLVSREEALLLDRMRENDNPWIVKFHLKQN